MSARIALVPITLGGSTGLLAAFMAGVAANGTSFFMLAFGAFRVAWALPRPVASPTAAARRARE